jgi:hypothetical protein
MQSLFAYIAHLFGIHSEATHQGLDEQRRKSLPANFGAIVLNGGAAAAALSLALPKPNSRTSSTSIPS